VPIASGPGWVATLFAFLSWNLWNVPTCRPRFLHLVSIFALFPLFFSPAASGPYHLGKMDTYGQGLGRLPFFSLLVRCIGLAAPVFTVGRSTCFRFGTELMELPEPNVSCQEFFADSKVRAFSPCRFAGRRLPLRVRGPSQQRGKRCRGSIHNGAAGQPNCARRANSDFLRSGEGLIPAQLPVAKERHSNRRCNFFDIHDTTYGGFRQPCAIYGGRHE